MNHKTQEQSYFYEVQGNHVVECEDYRYVGFHAMWSKEVHFSRTCCLHHQGRIWYFANNIKCYGLQDRSLVHEVADGEVNTQDFLPYIILSHSNINMPVYLYRGLFCYPPWHLSASPTLRLMLCRYCIVWGVTRRLNIWWIDKWYPW